MRIDELPVYVERMRRDVLAEALSTATAVWWERRAEQLAAALPRSGDFPGRAPVETPEERAVRVGAMVRACRERAMVSLGNDKMMIASNDEMMIASTSGVVA